jgi:hypothetical protein
MPVESVVVSLGVLAVFALFSVVLFWANRQTDRK